MKKRNAPSQQKIQGKGKLHPVVFTEARSKLLEESQDAGEDIILHHTDCQGRHFESMDKCDSNRLYRSNKVVNNGISCSNCRMLFSSQIVTRFICNQCENSYCIPCANNLSLTEQDPPVPVSILKKGGLKGKAQITVGVSKKSKPVCKGT